MWDLRRFENPVYTFSEHEMTPFARFLKSSAVEAVVSACQDSKLNILPAGEPTPLQSALLNSGVVCQDNLPENNGQTTAWSDSLQVIICADLVQQLHLYTYCIKTN